MLGWGGKSRENDLAGSFVDSEWSFFVKRFQKMRQFLAVNAVEFFSIGAVENEISAHNRVMSVSAKNRSVVRNPVFD